MLADPEGSPPVPFIFAFSQCPWQSPGKNTGMGGHLKVLASSHTKRIHLPLMLLKNATGEKIH